MIEAINAENFRIYFDTRNLFAMKGYDSVSILETMMPHICEVHIKDGVDGGPSTLLGQGNSGFADSMQVLKAHNYTGWLLLENSYGKMAKATELTAEALLKKDIQ
ncbi:MAG: sugar phosphate isomerase/epimerase, partial [Anaerolineales bacterium]